MGKEQIPVSEPRLGIEDLKLIRTILEEEITLGAVDSSQTEDILRKIEAAQATGTIEDLSDNDLYYIIQDLFHNNHTTGESLRQLSPNADGNGMLRRAGEKKTGRSSRLGSETLYAP